MNIYFGTKHFLMYESQTVFGQHPPFFSALVLNSKWCVANIGVIGSLTVCYLRKLNWIDIISGAEQVVDETWSIKIKVPAIRMHQIVWWALRHCNVCPQKEKSSMNEWVVLFLLVSGGTRHFVFLDSFLEFFFNALNSPSQSSARGHDRKHSFLVDTFKLNWYARSRGTWIWSARNA